MISVRTVEPRSEILKKRSSPLICGSPTLITRSWSVVAMALPHQPAGVQHAGVRGEGGDEHRQRLDTAQTGSVGKLAHPTTADGDTRRDVAGSNQGGQRCRQ